MLGCLKRLRASISTVTQYLRLTPFETETADGRSKERHRRALLASLANLFARAISLIALFVSLRIALPFLGEERFGVMATVMSFAGLLSFLDLGIGNGLVSHVARLNADDDRLALAVQVGNALYILGVIGIVCSLALIGLALTVPLQNAFKGVQIATLIEARSTLIVFAVIFGLAVPLGAVQNVLTGMQQGYIAPLVSAGVSVLSLLLLYLLPHFDAGIPSFLVVTYGMQVVAGALMLWILYVKRLVACPVSFGLRNAFSSSETKKLLKVGGLFFILQICSIITSGIDVLLISSTLGPALVASYVLAQRMFMLVSGPLAIINKPLWASYADAAHRGDRDYIRRTFRRSMVMTPLIGMLMASAIVINREMFGEVLSKGTVVLGSTFVFLYAMWAVLESSGNALAMYMNGLHIVRPQVVVIGLFVASSIVLKIFLLSHFGLNGILLAAIMAYLFAVALPYATIFRKTLLNAAP
jgi:O-antigen/teichoic acid export membrane protein